MSFSELMESGRGPGVIGTLMALLVLAGFGCLYIFVFDERLQGNNHSIDFLINNQSREIKELKMLKKSGDKHLASSSLILASVRELTALKRENLYREGKLDSLRDGITSAKIAIEAKNQEIEDYKEKYRNFTRSRAKGMTMEQLKTLSGDVYVNVSIREVSPVGVQILYRDGLKRIPFEELPTEMQDHFQFDPKQKAQTLAREESARGEHEDAVSAVREVENRKQVERRQREEDSTREINNKTMARMEVRIESLKKEIIELDKSIQLEGLKRLSRAPQMRQQLAAKKREKTSLEAEVTRLRVTP